jgi:ribosome-associated toxin RatA of RatAB toxin-antitoxin module
MSTTPLPQADTPRAQRVKKRFYVPLILLLLMLGVALGFFVRGTWADTKEKNPAGPEAGTVTQLLRQPDGNVVVRCAVIAHAPPKDVWAVVTDYAHHNRFLPYVGRVAATQQDDGRLLIDGVAHSRIWGDWPFQSLVAHKESPDDGQYATSWSEENKDVFQINRGGWTVSCFGQADTLLVFTLQVELKHYPNFIVRNVIMDRLHAVVQAMRDEAHKRRTQS